MVGERVLAEDDEEDLAPAIVVVGDAIKGDGDQHLDVDDGKGLGVDRGLLGLEGVEGSLAISRGLGGGGRRLALGLGALVVVGHGEG